MAEKKRRDPEPVEPVVLNGIRYEAPILGGEVDEHQDGGIVAAIDEKTGRLLWTAVIYPQEHDPDMEDDKQDVFIRSMAPDAKGKRLKIVNELGKAFWLDLATQKVSKVWLNL